MHRMELQDLKNIFEQGEVTSSIRATWNRFVPQLVATQVDIRISDNESLASQLAAIYADRYALQIKRGWETYGFPETIESLQHGTGGIKIISITTPRYHATAFISSDLSEVVGFLYLARYDRT